MATTQPELTGPGAGPLGFAQLRAQAAAQLAEVDRLTRDYEDRIQAAFAASAEHGDALAQAVMVDAYAMRVLGNGLHETAAAMRDAAVTEAATALQERREFEQARAEEKAVRPRRARSGDRHLGVVRSAGAGAAVLGTCFRAGARHSVLVKTTAAAAAVGMTASFSVATMHRLDDEDQYLPQGRAGASVAPSTAVPVSSSVPLSPAPSGRHSYPAERNRMLVLAPASSWAPSPQPATYSYSSSNYDTSTSSDTITWQSDTSQSGGQQDSGMQVQGGDGSQQNAGWQGSSQQGPGQGGGQQGGNWQRAGWQFQGPQGNQWGQGNQWNNRDGRGSWGQQGYQGGRDGFQSHQDGSWTYRDNSQQQGPSGGGWQQQGSGHDGGHGYGR